MKRVLLFLWISILWWSSVQAYTQVQVNTAINQVMERFDTNTQLEKLNEVIPKLGAAQLASTTADGFDLLKQVEVAVRARIAYLISQQVDLDLDPPTALEQELYEDMNKRRAQRWLATMEYNYKLAQAAQILADDMSEQGFFAHVNPQWVWYTQRLSVVWYEFAYVSENLVQGNVSPVQVNQLWTDSPTHEVNLYNTQSVQVWVGHQPDGHYRVAVYAKPL